MNSTPLLFYSDAIEDACPISWRHLEVLFFSIINESRSLSICSLNFGSDVGNFKSSVCSRAQIESRSCCTCLVTDSFSVDIGIPEFKEISSNWWSRLLGGCRDDKALSSCLWTHLGALLLDNTSESRFGTCVFASVMICSGLGPVFQFSGKYLVFQNCENGTKKKPKCLTGNEVRLYRIGRTQKSADTTTLVMTSSNVYWKCTFMDLLHERFLESIFREGYVFKKIYKIMWQVLKSICSFRCSKRVEDYGHIAFPLLRAFPLISWMHLGTLFCAKSIESPFLRSPTSYFLIIFAEKTSSTVLEGNL